MRNKGLIFLVFSFLLINGALEGNASIHFPYLINRGLIFLASNHANSNDSSQFYFDSILKNLHQELIHSKINQDKKKEVSAYIQIAFLYSRYFFNDSALIYLKKGLNIGSQIDYEYYFPYLTQQIANKYWDIGDYYNALENALLLKKYYEDKNLPEDREYLMNLLGIIYLRIEDYSNAYEYLNRAIKIAERKRNYGMLGVIYSNLGDLFLKQQKYSEALTYIEKGVALEQKNKLFNNAGRSFDLVAKLYIDTHDYIKAENNLNKALKYNHLASDSAGLMRTFITYGKLYNDLGKYNLAIHYLNKAEALSQKEVSNEYFMTVCEQLSISYNKLNQYKQALSYQIEYDSLYKKVFSIKGLAETKKLEYDLGIEKQNNYFNQYKLKKQKAILILLIIGICLSFTTTLLFIFIYRRTKKSKESIQAKNIEINEQKENLYRINLDLKEARERADAANQLKSSFLKNLSHEIRTPLNSILGFSELLQRKTNTQDEINMYLEKINSGKDDLLDIINNVVFASQFETKQYVLVKNKFNLNECINILLSDSRILLNRLNKSHILITPLLETTEGLIIETDKENLLIALKQLINNAIKFSDSGEIIIRSKIIDNAAIEFSINDTGIGIDQSQFSNIFDRFYKIETEKDRLFRGAGIGLTLVKDITEAMGGSIRVESTLGIGSTFYLTIPVQISTNANI